MVGSWRAGFYDPNLTRGQIDCEDFLPPCLLDDRSLVELAVGEALD